MNSLPPSEQDRIYKSRQNDVWEFTEDKNGHSWTRTASNYEVVGGSHRAFSSRSECEDNARMVGYQDEYRAGYDARWEFYQDSKNEYRWRLVDRTGAIINNAHEGYKTEVACLKNAVRHGYGQAPAVEPIGAGPGCGPLLWLIVLLLAAMALLFLLRRCTIATPRPPTGDTPPVAEEPVTEPTQPQPEEPEPAPTPVGQEFEQMFTDVAVDDWFTPYVHKMAKQKVINGYKTVDGYPTGAYGPADSVSLEQLAKIAMTATRVNLSTCSRAWREPKGLHWAEPYLQCARYRGLRVFADPNQDFSRPATRAEVAGTIIDAFGRREERTTPQFTDVGLHTDYGAAINTLAMDNIVSGKESMFGKALGLYGPKDPVQRAEVAKMFCRTTATYQGE